MRSGLVVPLIIVALLACVLGFFVTREIAPDAPFSPVRVSVVALPSTPTPGPAPTPEPTSSPSSSSSRSRPRDPNCPAGCECQHPAGGIVIVCR
ncbi:MAG: hypothetical protein WD646_03565 [Actinomycetota bacterium]